MADGISGSQELQAVADRLHRASRGELVDRMLAGLRESLGDTGKDALARARDILPRSGGLAELVGSSSMTIEARVNGDEARANLTPTGRVRNLAGIDEGTVSHGVFNTGVSVLQAVNEKWFGQPAEASEPKVTALVDRIVGDLAQQIEG